MPNLGSAWIQIMPDLGSAWIQTMPDLGSNCLQQLSAALRLVGNPHLRIRFISNGIKQCRSRSSDIYEAS